VRLRHRLAEVRRPSPIAVAVAAAMAAAVLAWIFLRSRLGRASTADPQPA
jgi:hypothetical protein